MVRCQCGERCVATQGSNAKHVECGALQSVGAREDRAEVGIAWRIGMPRVFDHQQSFVQLQHHAQSEAVLGVAAILTPQAHQPAAVIADALADLRQLDRTDIGAQRRQRAGHRGPGHVEFRKGCRGHHPIISAASRCQLASAGAMFRPGISTSPRWTNTG